MREPTLLSRPGPSGSVSRHRRDPVADLRQPCCGGGRHDRSQRGPRRRRQSTDDAARRRRTRHHRCSSGCRSGTPHPRVEIACRAGQSVRGQRVTVNDQVSNLMFVERLDKLSEVGVQLHRRHLRRPCAGAPRPLLSAPRPVGRARTRDRRRRHPNSGGSRPRPSLPRHDSSARPRSTAQWEWSRVVGSWL